MTVRVTELVVVFRRGMEDSKAALEHVDIEALKIEAEAAGSTPEPPHDDAPPLPAAAAAAATTADSDSDDDEWDVSIVDDSAAKIDYNGAGSYMI